MSEADIRMCGKQKAGIVHTETSSVCGARIVPEVRVLILLVVLDIQFRRASRTKDGDDYDCLASP